MSATEQALERTMLWMFVQLVAETVHCACGTPPNDNGSPCASCLASQMLQDVAPGRSQGQWKIEVRAA